MTKVSVRYLFSSLCYSKKYLLYILVPGLWLYVMATVPCFAVMTFFVFAEIIINGCWAIGLFFYLLFIASLTGIRLEARHQGPTQ